ncbi:MAG: LysM peptidoglycan-binding domain-containing protein [Pseudomonadota bacterium]|nr:LysM peptidoglycan-binding domain-containing protein [Pseudomonadota bacterium]
MLRIFLLTCLAFPVTMPPALAGPSPLVVLENDQRQTGEKSKSSASKFAENPDHSERHKVKKGDSLFKIIKKYYADAGLDRNFLELAIVKANRGAFVRNNPNFLYAGRVLHLPSVNQIKSMVMHPYASGEARAHQPEPTGHIFFIGH